MSEFEESKWDMELEFKPDFEKSMERIYAWYDQQIIDRPPIRFSAHNAEFNSVDENDNQWATLEDKWFDVEYQVESFIESLPKQKFYAETFPFFWANLGPVAYSAFYGAKIDFGQVTSWANNIVKSTDDIDKLKFDKENSYFKKIDQITNYALDRCEGKFMVGFTDLHSGMDCVADWRGAENLCMDMITQPDMVKKLCELSVKDFYEIYDHYDTMLKSHNQLSINWMGIPSFGRLHVPSCDFATMISPEMFNEFSLPLIQHEISNMTHNIFHLDGKGVARHIDVLLEQPEIQAIQWVQGVGEDEPIMPWVDFISKIQAAGKSVVVDLKEAEIEEFIEAMKPEGLLLCISADEKDQPAIIGRVKKW